MSQANANRLISKLRYKVRDRRNLSNPDGFQGRHNKIRKTVSALFKYERIEMNYHRADESRGYAERLISDAIRYGDTHEPTMEMANYWLLEKQLVHKLFKVLVPRYQNFGLSYTKVWRAPNVYPGYGLPKCILELRNNIFPTLSEDKSHNKNLIHNVLLESAKKAFIARKAAGAAEASSEAAKLGVVAERENAAEASNEAARLGVAERESAAVAGGTSESTGMSMSDKASQEDTNTDVKMSAVESESSGAVPNLEEDLSKLEITEDKSKESSSKDEKR